MAKLLGGTRIYGNAAIDSNLSISGNADSISATTGALTVKGGGGFAGNIFAANVYTNGFYWSANGTQINFGQPGSPSNSVQFNNGGALGGSTVLYYTSNSSMVVSNAGTSTSTTSGALQVIGGAGIGGNLYVGGGINTSAGLYATGAYSGGYSGDGVVIEHNNAVGGVQISAGTGDSYRFYNGGIATTELLRIDSTGNVVIPATTTSANTTTGALVIKGGTGIAGTLQVGGAATLASTLGVTGATTLSSTLSVSSTASFTTTGTVQATSATALLWGGSTANVGYNFGYGATTATNTKNISIGANGAASSYTNIGVGPATVGSYGNVYLYPATLLTVSNTAAATTAATGAIQVAGGISVNANSYFGGNVSTGALLNTASWTTVSNVNAYQIGMGVNTAQGSLALAMGQTNSPGAFMVIAASGGKNQIYNTNRDFRIFAVNDGLEALYITNANGNVVMNSTTSSADVNSGALIVKGGVGVGGSIYAGALYDAGSRVVSTTSGAGNLTITANSVSLTTTGPGATTWGSSSQIPSITFDAYGRATTASQTALNTVAVTNLANTSEITSNSSVGIAGLSLTTTGVTAGNYGSSTSIPTIVVDTKGRVTSVTTNAVSTTISLTGTTGTGSISGGGTLTFSSTNGVVIAASGSTISISDPQDIRTSASPTFAGLTSTGNTVVSGTSYFTGITTVTNTTDSTNATTGALVVSGGVGISGNVFIGGTLTVANLQARGSSQITVQDPLLYLQANVLYPWSYDTGIYSDSRGGPANTYVHHGMVRNVTAGQWSFFSNVKSEPDQTINWADAGLIWDQIKSGDITIANTTASTNTTTGALVVAGGVGIAGNLNVNSAAYFGYNASQTSLINPSIIGTSSSQAVNAGQYFVQSALINTNATGSSDIAAYPNNTTDGLTGFMDMGFTGNLFSDPLYTITKANDGYLFASAKSGAGLGGNLVLATDQTGTYNDIVFATGSFYANAEVARFRGNASNSGYLTISTGTAASSTSTGALRVSGGVGVTGSIYANALYTDNLRFANGNPFVSTTIANSAEIVANISSGTNVGLTLTATGVTANTYGSSTAVPVITVDSKGRITGVTTSTISGSLTFTGDVTGTGSTGSSTTLTLANSGVTAGNYGSATNIPTIVVDSKGRITSITTNAVSTTISLTGTSGTGSVAGGGTLTFASTNGVVASVSGSTVTISDPQDIRTSASPTFAGGTFNGNVTRSSRPLITNTTGTAAPSSPIQGDEWYNSTTGILYKYIFDGTSNVWVNMSSALFNANTGAVANTLALRDSGANLTASNFIGVASSAKYADLAELYTPDAVYQPATVVVFGGTEEVTISTESHDTRVAGVVSTNPAYLMNSELAGGVAVAFTGRVPCQVQGPVTKGSLLVTSDIPGVAQKLDNTKYLPGCVIGKALANIDNNEIATIEVAVGRF